MFQVVFSYNRVREMGGGYKNSGVRYLMLCNMNMCEKIIKKSEKVVFMV